MIISASYKTDIPAFYGTWFLKRLDAGVCRMRNPYGGQIYEVPLDLASVDGFVFWTRNAGPFLPVLREVRRRGYPFAVQYTITGYGRPLELSVPGPDKMVEIARRLAEEFGPRAVAWRYDPILISSATPAPTGGRSGRGEAAQSRGNPPPPLAGAQGATYISVRYKGLPQLHEPGQDKLNGRPAEPPRRERK